MLVFLIFTIHTSHLLLINEVFFGENGFIELLDENEEVIDDNTANSYEGSRIIIGKRLQHSHHIHVDAVVDLSQMVKTLNNFILIQASSQQTTVSSSSTNTMMIGNTHFAQHINNDNVLLMDENTVMIILLMLGPLLPDLIAQGAQKRVILDEKLLDKLVPTIKDTLIFRGINGKSPTKMVKHLQHHSLLTGKLPKRYLSTGAHSFSRCSETTTPYLSNTFKDTSPRYVTS